MKRHKYNLGYYNTTSMNMGDLVPIGLTEVLPGDTFKHSTTALVRFGPMLAPVMHPTHCYIHHWFVPHRLVWEDWEDFITGGPDGMDASSFPRINLTDTASAPGTLADYLGVGQTAAGGIQVSALPFRGYAKIWNEWYRDQDLQTELVVSEASGVDATTSTTLQKKGWQKDYFTTARPWTQKGPEISMPIDSPIQVESTGTAVTLSPVGGTANQNLRTATTGALSVPIGPGATANTTFGTSTGLEIDMAAAMGNINELRLAFALQRYEEARARYGSRYTEYLRYLGVKSSDARLQRPEYLGGGKQTIQFSEVLATAEGTNTEVGDLKGHGIASARSNKYLRFFEEHGYVFTFMSVMPITTYVNGTQRHWWRRTKEDFFQKELQYIGQQAIKTAEIYTNGVSFDDEWAYQDRYAEYRQGFNIVSGRFKTDLDYWHLGRDFASAPTLNAAFVAGNPTDRVFADQSADAENVWCMIKHNIGARRIVGPGGKSFVF